jgi:hypothetical protein
MTKLKVNLHTTVLKSDRLPSETAPLLIAIPPRQTPPVMPKGRMAISPFHLTSSCPILSQHSIQLLASLPHQRQDTAMARVDSVPARPAPLLEDHHPEEKRNFVSKGSWMHCQSIGMRGMFVDFWL